MITGLCFLSCKNSPDIKGTTITAVGPSQPVDSMKQVASGVNLAVTGNTGKADTTTKITNPPVDTIPRKNLNP